MQLPHLFVGGSISGKVRQVPLKDDKLREDWAALVMKTAASLEVADSQQQQYVVDCKLLVAAPKKGHQSVHWDAERAVASRTKYSCILICSSGTNSTALPTFMENHDFSCSSKRSVMRSLAHLLQPEHYRSQMAMSGEIIFFRQTTPHHGVRNDMEVGKRVVLFSMLSSSSAEGQDSFQVFPWLYVRHAFGPESPEFAQSLLDAKSHDVNPIQRLKDDEGPKAAKEARFCLTRFGLLDAYNAKP
jgi:hypothetical protein